MFRNATCCRRQVCQGIDQRLVLSPEGEFMSDLKRGRRAFLGAALASAALPLVACGGGGGGGDGFGVTTRQEVVTDFGTFGLVDRAGPQRALVFIHGNSISSHIFELLLQTEALKQHRLVLVNMPGSGVVPDAPDPIKDYSLFAFADGIAQALQTANVPAGAVLVGWSQGGMVAIEALQRGRSGDYLALLASAPVGHAPPEAGPAYTLPAWFSIDPWTETQYLEFAQAVMSPITTLPDWLLTDIRGSDPKQRTDISITAYSLGQITDEVAYVANSTKSTAVIVGDSDFGVPTKYLDTIKWGNKWRGATQLVHGHGHGLAWTAPDQVAQLLADFADSL
jgi:pimeloyl-ACP methyl ester carboxylesterase